MRISIREGMYIDMTMDSKIGSVACIRYVPCGEGDGK